MKKFGAEAIILVMIIPILMTLSGYVASKAIDNEKDISSLKTSDKYQSKKFDRIERKLDLILIKVK